MKAITFRFKSLTEVKLPRWMTLRTKILDFIGNSRSAVFSPQLRRFSQIFLLKKTICAICGLFPIMSNLFDTPPDTPYNPAHVHSNLVARDARQSPRI